MPDPVRRHRHRRTVVRSHVLITGDECRRTSRGRHSAPRAPQESGATIPGTQRRPGQTHTRARGTIEARPPTRHTPPATKNYQKAAQFSSFRVPRSGIETHKKRTTFLLRKSGPELAGWRNNTPRPPLVAGGALLSGGRASVVPDPVRRHRHRHTVVRSHVLITGDECRRTSRGRHSAPRAPQESGATIPGTQRRPGQTHTRARGTIEARPPTRHTPPATKNYQKAAQFSSFRVPRSGIRDS